MRLSCIKFNRNLFTLKIKITTNQSTTNRRRVDYKHGLEYYLQNPVGINKLPIITINNNLINTSKTVVVQVLDN